MKSVELFRDNIAGVQYGDYQAVKKFTIGRELKLTWERNNKFDDLAIMITYDGVKLGYVKKSDNQELLHQYRKNGIKVRAFLTAFNKNNPSWNALSYKVTTQKPLDNVEDSF